MNEQTLMDVINSLLTQLDAKNHQIEWLQSLVEKITTENKKGEEIE